MALTPSLADMAYDWELWIGRTEGTPAVTTWTQIYGFESLPFPDQVPEDRNVTHMQSPGRTRETAPGLLPVGDWSQDKQIWAGDPGDVLLQALADLTLAGTPEDVLVEFNIAGASRRTYRGYVNSYIPNGTVGDNAMATVAIKIKDKQATNPRVIPE